MSKIEYQCDKYYSSGFNYSPTVGIRKLISHKLKGGHKAPPLQVNITDKIYYWLFPNILPERGISIRLWRHSRKIYFAINIPNTPASQVG
jgi:hypothetical protein